MAIWEAARSETYGVVLNVHPLTPAKMALYQARIKANDNELAGFEIREPRPGTKAAEAGNLLIIRTQRAPKLATNNFGNINLSGVLDLDLDV